MKLSYLFLALILSPTHGFFVSDQRRKSVTENHPLSAIVAIRASELEKDLSNDEKTVVSVVRNSGPSVAFVVSVLPLTPQDEQRLARGGRIPPRDTDLRGLPLGRVLGSGSAFVVDSRGYLVTNYHVVEQAYTIRRVAQELNTTLDQVAGNLTFAADVVNTTIRNYIGRQLILPQVYVRMDNSNFQQCRFVGVRPELDVAVLKVENVTLSALSFGSSSDLLVGQSLIAIGNPFGLDNTVTTGVVSALNREIGVPNRQPIRNCIQTDCAINPGNSGGPLLNLQGRVIGVNTAIVTTSGSNAGIGFAVPADPVEPVVAEIIRNDLATSCWLGVSILKQNQKCVVASVRRDSPADRAGIRALRVGSDSIAKYGDAIVAVGGNEVSSYGELRHELDSRKVGEQIAVTLEDADGERRVAYLTLEARP